MKSISEALSETRGAAIVRAIRRARGDLTEAAQLLGRSRGWLYGQMTPALWREVDRARRGAARTGRPRKEG